MSVKPRKARRAYTIHLPPHRLLDDLVALDGDVLTMAAPLSLGINPTRGVHWAHLYRFEKAAKTLTATLVGLALRGVERRPWADRARLSVVRCSLGSRTLDGDALHYGLKPIIDASWRAGLLPDDDQEHLLTPIEVEDRRRGHWGALEGPGTWLTWRRVG